MIKKIAIASIIVGSACFAVGTIAKLIHYGNIHGISPSGFCQGADILLLLSIGLLLLEKKS